MTIAPELRESAVRSSARRHRRLIVVVALLAVVVAVVLAVVLTVAARPATGSATIEIAADTPGRAVTVVVSTGGWSTTRHVVPGETLRVDGVPNGWVTIDAKGLCTVASHVGASTPSISLSYSDRHCVLGD